MDNFSKTDSTEEKILEAAKKVFLKKGMYGARMQEIADEAGINKALLHYYFRSKDKLFESIFEEAFQEFVPKAFNVLRSEIPFEEKIAGFVSNYIDMVLENPFMPIFIINEINQNPERMIPITRLMQVLKESVFKEMQEKAQSGVYRNVDPLQLFSSIISMTLFPFLARPLIQGAFGYDDHQFRNFIEERKRLVPDIVLTYLKSVSS